MKIDNFETTDNSKTSEKNITEYSNKKSLFKRHKGCPLSLPGVGPIDYKNPDLLVKYISEGGRMIPSRVTNVCAKKQRELRKAVKIARILSLLPFVFKA